MMTKKKLSKALVPALVLFSVGVLAAAVARGITHDRFRQEMDEADMVEVDKKSLPGLIWFEIKQLFDFNRFK